MRAMEYLQLDPLQIVARSQDLALHSRVIDYSPGMWEKLCYEERKFFDWGGWLAVRPMDELPYWRVIMRRERRDPRIGRVLFFDSFRRALGRRHREVIEEMLAEVRAKGTVSNRNFAIHTRRRVESCRGRKDSAVALYYLWRVGELMTHHRERFERVYGLAETIAPAHLLRESGDEEADDFIIRKTIAFYGLHRLSGGGNGGDIGNPVLSRLLRRPVKAKEIARIRERMLSQGEIVEVNIEGLKNVHYAVAGDASNLREVSAGRVPLAWNPYDTTTQEEVTFLSPLDIVTARDRGRSLFDFDYKWEVYVPTPQRKYGYYALPILWDDGFVGRSDLKFERASNTLIVCGIWFEDRKTAANPAFNDALIRGFARFMRFLGATKVDASAVGPRSMRKLLSSLNGESNLRSD
jgi:uncharacterized protein YcaQ